MTLDANRNAIENVYIDQLYKNSKGQLAIKTVAMVPQREPDVRRLLQPLDPLTGPYVPELRPQEASVDREGDPGRQRHSQVVMDA